MQDKDTAEVVLRRTCDVPLGSSVYVVRGVSAILRLQSLLIAFSKQCECDAGTLVDLPYFLQKPGFLKRQPYLFLVARQSGVAVSSLTPPDLTGAVLLLEYRLFGMGTRTFASNDRSGSGTLLARPAERAQVAALICGVLMGHSALVGMLSFTGADVGEVRNESIFRELGRRKRGVRWAVRHRHRPAYLSLASTLDATLVNLGQKTRSNMRYYRRRAERELGCTFVPAVQAGVDELLQFNTACMYAVDRAALVWRLGVLSRLHAPFFMGLQDRDGQWLSMVAGRRFGTTAEILWQMNRDGYPQHSLGTVMRSYCIEQVIAEGAQRLQVEGGTYHSMHHSFVTEQVLDLVIVRSVAHRPLRSLVRRYIPQENSLAEMLTSDDLQWQNA